MSIIKDERLVKAITAIYEHGFMRRTSSEPMDAAVTVIANLIADLQADSKRMDFLQSLVENPSHYKEGITICTRWPDGVMLINPAHLREAVDVLMKQPQK